MFGGSQSAADGATGVFETPAADGRSTPTAEVDADTATTTTALDERPITSVEDAGQSDDETEEEEGEPGSQPGEGPEPIHSDAPAALRRHGCTTVAQNAYRRLVLPIVQDELRQISVSSCRDAIEDLPL